MVIRCANSLTLKLKELILPIFKLHGLTQEQLKSTASYKAKDLSGITFDGYDLSGWDFHGQKLTNVDFLSTKVNNADFTDADIRREQILGIKAGSLPAQLQSTASFIKQKIFPVPGFGAST